MIPELFPGGPGPGAAADLQPPNLPPNGVRGDSLGPTSNIEVDPADNVNLLHTTDRTTKKSEKKINNNAAGNHSDTSSSEEDNSLHSPE